MKALLRRLLERGSRNVMLKRKLPACFGGRAIYVSPDAALRFWKPGLDEADPLLYALARRFVAPGTVAWDAGANVGLFTFAASALAGRKGTVVAIEADAWLQTLLRRSAAEAPPDAAPVAVVPAAVADKLGLEPFVIAARGRASNYLDSAVNTQTGGIRDVQSVITVTLDWLLEYFPAPLVVKVDVEGAELRVLQGSERMLRQVRPTWLLEVASTCAAEITRLLREANYALFRPTPQELLPVNEADWDTVAIPAERA
jgi:FkbM family methyltransferase